jgi:hypothetical protein
MKYEVFEHHFNPHTLKFTKVPLKAVTNKRREIRRLAEIREGGGMPPTLSHWTVGPTRVRAQFALEIYDRRDEVPK